MLSDCQFGFRKNCSTIFAINKIYNDLLNNIDQNVYTCCVVLDLSKALIRLIIQFYSKNLKKCMDFVEAH